MIELMDPRANDTRPPTSNPHQFAAHLAQLKQDGCALLIVGRVPTDQYVQACARLLGDDDAGPRRRLFVITDTDLPGVSNRYALPSTRISPATTKQIAWRSEARSTATTAPTDTPDIPTTHLHDSGLANLGIEISDAIETFDEQADGLSPAELRLCFNSLDSLLSEHPRAAVFRFLHILIGRLHNVHGMGHFHLPVARETEVVRLFEELFDATIELRLHDSTFQHRWHLHEADLTSTWLPMAQS